MWYSFFFDVLRLINNSRGYDTAPPPREDTIRVRRRSPDAYYTPPWTPPQSPLPSTTLPLRGTSSTLTSRALPSTRLPSSSTTTPPWAPRASPPPQSPLPSTTVPLRVTSSTLTSRALPSTHLPSSSTTTPPWAPRASPPPQSPLPSTIQPLRCTSCTSSTLTSRALPSTRLPSSSTTTPTWVPRASPPPQSPLPSTTLPLRVTSLPSSSTTTPTWVPRASSPPQSPLPSTTLPLRGTSSTLTSRALLSTHLPSSSTTTPTWAWRAISSTPLPSKATPSPFFTSKASSSTQRPLPAPSTSRASTSTPLSTKTPCLSPDNGGKSSEFNSGTEKKSTLLRYEIPKYLEDLIKKDRVPSVLKFPLTLSTYADYFASLLYAEDYYHEKWSNFLLSKVTLELRSRATFNNALQMNKKDFVDFEIGSVLERRPFVAFEIDSVPERMPFLLSRDFVFVRPSGKRAEPFKGILFRVVKSTLVLVEFEDDFHQQHSSTKKYDVSFSFNRVCLKRSHHAVSAAKEPSLCKILFPDERPNPSFSHIPPSTRILNHEGPLPYLIEGPLSTFFTKKLSSTGNVIQDGKLAITGSVIQDATLQIYRSVPHCRILICAPRNLTCDVLMRSLQNEIPRSKLFRVNAAFRDYDLVPDDIIPACHYKGECFDCPPLSELKNFKVITCTFMSSFRLHYAGISADHFTHIFLVDASSATEPEAVVALVNLISKKTVVVVTGSSYDFPHWIRSDIARKNGLKVSYFHRLLRREPYSSQDPKFITHLSPKG